MAKKSKTKNKTKKKKLVQSSSASVTKRRKHPYIAQVKEILDDVDDFLDYVKQKKYLRINSGDLWTACKVHAQQMDKVGRMVSKAKSGVSLAKLCVEDVEGEAMILARKQLDGATVNDIKVAAAGDSMVREAKRLLVDAEKTYGDVVSKKEAMNHKKSLLRDMVKMLIYASMGEGTDFITEKKAAAAAFRQKRKRFLKEQQHEDDEEDFEEEEEEKKGR